MPPVYGNTTRRISGLIVACSIVACTSTEQPPADTTVAAGLPTASAASSGEDWLNKLDGDALLKELNDGSRWVKSTDSPKQRRCASGSCGAGGPAKVELWVEKNAHNVGDEMAGDKAILVGKLRHVSGEQSRMYRVRPGPYIYALFILKGSATQGRYQIREVNTSTKQHTAHASGDWIRCGHAKKPAAEAYFRACNPPHALEGGQAAMDHEDPAWFTCTAGCCTAGSLAS